MPELNTIYNKEIDVLPKLRWFSFIHFVRNDDIQIICQYKDQQASPCQINFVLTPAML